jgi:chromosome segregation protein
MRREREEVLQDVHRRETRLVDNQGRLANLLERTEADFEITLPDASIEIQPDFDETDAREQVAELRTRIRNLGAVNALALETYDEEKERLDFLVSQHDDLASAEGTLLNTIHEINTTAARRFFETFERIQSYFSELFAELFGEGAQARLELGGEEDPLESPIEIFARPVGKKNVTISQLSGGEKTLTAIALLFSIYLVKPSPFCILDEVDAPLDDANIGRFMHLIRKFSKETQFVLVTHNKLTMEAADRMYGITMEQKGISKVVGVQFENSTELAGAVV